MKFTSINQEQEGTFSETKSNDENFVIILMKIQISRNAYYVNASKIIIILPFLQAIPFPLLNRLHSKNS